MQFYHSPKITVFHLLCLFLILSVVCSFRIASRRGRIERIAVLRELVRIVAYLRQTSPTAIGRKEKRRENNMHNVQSQEARSTEEYTHWCTTENGLSNYLITLALRVDSKKSRILTLGSGGLFNLLRATLQHDSLQ